MKMVYFFAFLVLQVYVMAMGSLQNELFIEGADTHKVHEKDTNTARYYNQVLPFLYNKAFAPKTRFYRNLVDP